VEVARATGWITWSPRSSRLQGRWRELARGDRIALIVFAVVLGASFIGPFFAPHPTSAQVGEPLSPPGQGSLFGTDDIGFDVFSRILYGARESWLGAFAVIAVGGTFGALVGLIAGAVGGWTDAILMRITDAFLALPAPMLAIAVVASLGPSFSHTLMAVVIVWWPVYARIVRGEVKSLASRQHLEAARLGGISRLRIWFRHLLPGAMQPVVITASLDVGALVLLLASLSFLGLGSPDPAPELGSMVAKGLPYLLSSPWVVLFPAAAVFVIAFVSNVAGDATRNLLSG
jgi:ABC-type dipeptide/oligopeptide/nickel transport system permease subunit